MSSADDVKLKQSHRFQVGLDSSLGVGETADGKISYREAFLVMTEFIWRYAQREGDDLAALMTYIGRASEAGSSGDAAWKEWLGYVEYLASGGALRASENSWNPASRHHGVDAHETKGCIRSLLARLLRRS